MISTYAELNYRHLLLDFRADIFRRLSVVIAMFCIVAAYALIFTNPLPHQLVFFLYLFSGFTLILRHRSQHSPNTARYIFVASLYVCLSVSMILLPVSWLPFLIFPVVFISELLVSYIHIILAALFFGYTVLLSHIGHAEYPLQPLALFLCLMLTVTNRGIEAINMLLLWYISTYQQANELLQETRTHRAELAQTLKSLETAYETQRRLQTQLMYARQQAEEARSLKERFASNISHELRTPLNIILGFAEIMHLTPEVYGDISFPPKLQRDIYQIHRNSRHLLEMIDDVLDLSHIDISQFSLRLERTDLNAFLNDTIAMVNNLFREKTVEFIVNIPGNLPEVEIDRTRIRQVIINLLNNAQRFTPNGRVTFSVAVNEKRVVFEVADTGIGIAEDKLVLIFAEFYQVDYSLSRAHGGAGLGLAITKRFVEAHNGRLRVTSQVGKGSVFTFTLPRPNTLRHDWRDSHALQLPNTNAPCALWLVVDADPNVGKLIARHTPGKQIVQVEDDSSLQEVIQQQSPQGIIVNKSPGHPLPPHLNDSPIPMIVCSLPSTTQMVKKLGVNGCLAKPVRTQQIIEQFERYDGLGSVLVVDDDLGVVQLVQRSIETQYPHIQVQRAYNGKQALQIMKLKRPDLILLDLAMPEMDGFEVIETIKDDPQLGSIPIILLTATKYIYSEEETRAEIVINQSGGLRPMGVLRLINTVMATVESSGSL
jgi:signal transduction histidine kinase/CheY-like chemotaxis protein